MVGMRTEPSVLWFGLPNRRGTSGSSPMGMPAVGGWDPRHGGGCSGSSPPPQLCQLVGRAGRCVCCWCLEGSAYSTELRI